MGFNSAFKGLKNLEFSFICANYPTHKKHNTTVLTKRVTGD